VVLIPENNWFYATSVFFSSYTWQLPDESAATSNEAFMAIERDLIPMSGDGVYDKLMLILLM